MTLDSDTFRSVLGRFASGITIITARDEGGQDVGMTVSAFCSLSLEPPMVLICIDHTAAMSRVLRESLHFGVSILAAGQEALSRRFAGVDTDRFEGIGFMRGQTGVVLLDGALAQLECRIVDLHDGGDHTICLAEVESAEARTDTPLLYYRGGYATLER
ncbi:MAG: flavin reductase family protein [Gemmatimonadaceae bacterium]